LLLEKILGDTKTNYSYHAAAFMDRRYYRSGDTKNNCRGLKAASHNYHIAEFKTESSGLICYSQQVSTIQSPRIRLPDDSERLRELQK
jgi:hypothetical protein